MRPGKIHLHDRIIWEPVQYNLLYGPFVYALTPPFNGDVICGLEGGR